MEQNFRNHTSQAELADIQAISVDQTLSKEERIAEFLRQIKNSLLLQMREIYRSGTVFPQWRIVGGLPETNPDLAL